MFDERQLTKEEETAMALDEFSTSPPRASARPQHSIARVIESTLRLADDVESCASVAAVAEPSKRSHFRGFPVCVKINFAEFPRAESLGQQLTAGSAKNEIPSSAQNDAIIFPCHVTGTMSPYPTVVRNRNKKFRMLFSVRQQSS